MDVYGSPLAPVGTSAPVPQDVLKQIEDNLDGIDSVITNDISDEVPEGERISATEEEDEYDEIEKEVIEDLVDQIKSELDDPTAITDPEEEKFLKEEETIVNDDTPKNDIKISDNTPKDKNYAKQTSNEKEIEEKSDRGPEEEVTFNKIESL